MELFPAIDLYDGKAVRLTQGDYQRMVVYSEDPAALAREFAAAGAKYLHVVDLEGAKSGRTPNFDVIAAIVKETDLQVEVGGGIRSQEIIRRYLDAGVMRTILGTAAATNPDFVSDMLKEFGRDSIAVGMDFRKNVLAVKGWTEDTELGCFDFCTDMEQRGVKTVIATNIAKDGMLEGVSCHFYAEYAEIFGMDFIASGGVTTLDDIRRLAKTKVAGAILGKALYEGNLSLADALAAAREG
ncbi:MAG: 1-(5-phosphoribosyl)-5-[Oscillospiraceae bacterium]|nr:1-(5-phosphoribosyl)-5-[(5-phosphoribosylamino)methylideneamino]imidazole-4-carboxamide isomerase [Oscillospiraceae bacterium]